VSRRSNRLLPASRPARLSRRRRRWVGWSHILTTPPTLSQRATGRALGIPHLRRRSRPQRRGPNGRQHRPGVDPGPGDRAYAPPRRSACRAPCGRLAPPHEPNPGGRRPPASRLPLRAVGRQLRAPLLAARARRATDRKQRGAALGTIALPTGATVRQRYLVCVGNSDLLAADASTLRSGIGRG